VCQAWSPGNLAHRVTRHPATWLTGRPGHHLPPGSPGNLAPPATNHATNSVGHSLADGQSDDLAHRAGPPGDLAHRAIW